MGPALHSLKVIAALLVYQLFTARGEAAYLCWKSLQMSAWNDMSALACTRAKANKEGSALLTWLEPGHIFSLLLNCVTALGFTKLHYI